MDQDVKSFRDLIVWHRSIELCVTIYEYSRSFPKEEMFGLQSQLRRAAVSTASNIAEGCGRRSSGEFAQFLGTANGSYNEVQTQLVIAGKLGYGSQELHFRCESLATEVAKMLNSLADRIEAKMRQRSKADSPTTSH